MRSGPLGLYGRSRLPNLEIRLTCIGKMRRCLTKVLFIFPSVSLFHFPLSHFPFHPFFPLSPHFSYILLFPCSIIFYLSFFSVSFLFCDSPILITLYFRFLDSLIPISSIYFVFISAVLIILCCLEFNNRINQVANGLAAAGVRHGNKVFPFSPSSRSLLHFPPLLLYSRLRNYWFIVFFFFFLKYDL